MSPKPEDGLRMLGATIRAVRTSRGLSQQRAAKDAGVSRAQLVILERGGNVSVKLLLKIATFLDLRVSLDGQNQLAAGQNGIDVFALVQTVDVLAAAVDDLRAFAINAILPLSERRILSDTPAVREFIARHPAGVTGGARLSDVIASRDGVSSEIPSAEDRQVARRQRRSRRRGE